MGEPQYRNLLFNIGSADVGREFLGVLCSDICIAGIGHQNGQVELFPQLGVVSKYCGSSKEKSYLFTAKAKKSGAAIVSLTKRSFFFTSTKEIG